MLSLEQVDRITFERAEQYMAEVTSSIRKGAAQYLRASYMAGITLADRDAASSRTRSAAQVIDYAMGEGAQSDFDAVTTFIAGYYRRLRWLNHTSSNSSSLPQLPSSRFSSYHFPAIRADNYDSDNGAYVIHYTAGAVGPQRS